MLHIQSLNLFGDSMFDAMRKRQSDMSLWSPRFGQSKACDFLHKRSMDEEEYKDTVESYG